MSKQDFFRTLFIQFFVIVTLINVVMFVLGILFRPDERFGYEAFLTPIIYAACSLIPAAITYSPKELSLRQMLLRQLLNLFAIEAIMIVIGIGRSPELAKQPLLVISFAISVFIIYVLVIIISWILDLGQAKQMNIDLENYQKNIKS